MKTLTILAFIGLSFSSVTFAGLGEDSKGDCEKISTVTREAQKAMDSHGAFDKKEKEVKAVNK